MKTEGFKDTIKYYDENAQAYADVAHQLSFEVIIDAFLKKLPTHPSILEAGCGTGRDAKVFFDRGAEVTGIDASSGLLEIARKENPQITFITGNFLHLPFEESTFDGVWSHASLVHLETIEEVHKALSEFHRVLKPKGLLYVLVKQQVGENKTEIVSDPILKHDRFFRYYTEDELADLFNKVGFEVIDQKLLDDPHGREGVKWIEIVGEKK